MPAPKIITAGIVFFGNSTIANGEKTVREMIHISNLIFMRTLNVKLKPAFFNQYNEHQNFIDDPIGIFKEVCENIGKVKKYKQEADILILVTDYPSKQLAVGMAQPQSACSEDFACAVVTKISQREDTFIHEIGHLFGAPHDGKDECIYNKENPKDENLTIMLPTGSGKISNNSQFSKCTTQQMNKYLTKEKCGKPLTEIFNDQKVPETCGDGILDPGEECDAGLGFCGSNSCCGCNCKLNPGSQCNPQKGSECCSNDCKFLSSGTNCGEYGHTVCSPAQKCNGKNSKCEKSNTDGLQCKYESISDIQFTPTENHAMICNSNQCVSRDFLCNLHIKGSQTCILKTQLSVDFGECSRLRCTVPMFNNTCVNINLPMLIPRYYHNNPAIQYEVDDNFFEASNAILDSMPCGKLGGKCLAGICLEVKNPMLILFKLGLNSLLAKIWAIVFTLTIITSSSYWLITRSFLLYENIKST
jgi:Metallo-peptidase family M12/Disintegrin